MSFPSAAASEIASPIVPRDYVTPGTGLHTALGWVAAFVATVGLILVTYGVAILFFCFYPLIRLSQRRKEQALLNGSAIQVGPHQFPLVHDSGQRMANRLGMSSVPDIYIYESNVQNAGASKVRGKKTILLTDDMVHGIELIGEPGVLDFIMAHELAHHCLGHTGFLRSRISSVYKKLSRLDEFSCDAVAAAAVDNKTISGKALALLAVGPQLVSQLNFETLVHQAQAVASDKKSRAAESSLTHPMVLRRFARVIGIELKC
ncbi:MAG: M48 family metalloprotease [Planctomycetota bacterium]